MALPKGFKHSEETKRKITATLSGRKHSKEWREAISSGLKGRKFSEEHRGKLSKSHKGLLVGSKHPNWRGGITPQNKAIRNSLKYREWRASIFRRDNYTCVLCGIVGVYLNLDHIKPFSLFPELRFEDSNARTLCVPCHRETPTYKGKMRNYGNN